MVSGLTKEVVFHYVLLKRWSSREGTLKGARDYDHASIIYHTSLHNISIAMYITESDWEIDIAALLMTSHVILKSQCQNIMLCQVQTSMW